jgi:hypothetical protein
VPINVESAKMTPAAAKKGNKAPRYQWWRRQSSWRLEWSRLAFSGTCLACCSGIPVIHDEEGRKEGALLVRVSVPKQLYTLA